ncbi:ATP-binding protein, partial [Micromonospora echinofusca]
PRTADSGATPPRSDGGLPLAVPATPLVGRDADIADVTAKLRQPDCRLLTLTGTGGVGKTRLSIAVGTALADEYPDGVLFVPLAPVREAALVMPTLGQIAGVTSGEPDDEIAVLDHFRHRQQLIVLDNFEHLTDAAADIADLVATCPEVTVLVTSRAALRVRGETEYPVQPLVLPATGRDTTVDAVVAAPASALFVERARAVAPGFTLTPENAPAVATICTRLAGIPLALEIAATRLRFLAPAALLARLDDALAAVGARDLPERQRSMHSTLDWSYELLDDPEQRLFRRLAVFADGFTLDAAESVGGSGVLASLERLVEQSLVAVTFDRDGTPRYRMLEPVAQYARSRLAGADEAQAVGYAHACFFLSLAEQAAPQHQRADQLRSLARLEAEHANLVVAVRWALVNGHPGISGRLGWALWLYWWLRGHLMLGRRFMEATLGHDLPAPVRGRTLCVVAGMAFAQGDHEAAGRWWRQAHQQASAAGDQHLLAHTLAGTGLVDLATGDATAAADAFRRAIPLADSLGQDGDWIGSLVQVWLGTTVMIQGDPAGAVPHIERGLTAARARGDRLATYVALFNLSQARMAQGEYEQARGDLREGIRLSEEIQDLANLAYFLDALAVVEDSADEPARVPTLLGAAQALRETVGAKVYGYYQPDETLRDHAAQRARSVLGEDTYDDALDSGRALDLAGIVRYALHP